jgi:O-6-methylguanine DNA methyltransferase
MSHHDDSIQTTTLQANRALVDDCRTLGVVNSPIDLAGRALAIIGLADWFTTVETPLGLVYIAWNASGLSLAQRTESREAFRAFARAVLGRSVTAGALPEALARGTRAWLAGDNRAQLAFDLTQLTAFERATLMKTREIPHGEVRPYGWIAREIGHPRAVRAVGTALARNPIPLFIPCHRVVRTDGMLGKYSMGGPANKRTILSAEGVDVERLEWLTSKGVRFVGNAADDSYCYPTCYAAREISAERLVMFHDEAIALARGYHPCNSCRPPAAQLAS